MARYKDAIFWIIANDDTEWLGEPKPVISMSAELVQYLFRKFEYELIADLRAELARQRKMKEITVG